jgi:hypothetical protein
MSTVSALALALLFAAEPTDAPPAAPPPTAEPAAAPSLPAALTPDPAAVPSLASGAPMATATVTTTAAWEPTSTSRGLVRAGLGVSVTDADSGFASTFQAGVQVDPWNRFGFRAGMGMTTSTVGAGGWDAAEFSASALYRPLGQNRRVVPYLGLGVQVAIMAIFPDGAPLPSEGLARLAPGHLAPLLAVDANGDMYPNAVDGFGGTNQIKVMPELTAGAIIKLSQRLDLDLSARYLPLFWNGTTYNGLSVVAAICAPF